MADQAGCENGAQGHKIRKTFIRFKEKMVYIKSVIDTRGSLSEINCFFN